MWPDTFPVFRVLSLAWTFDSLAAIWHRDHPLIGKTLWGPLIIPDPVAHISPNIQ